MTRLIALVCLLLAAGGAATPPPTVAAPTISHVVIIAMENHSRSQVIGSSSAPYITGLARTYGEATDYVNLYHPSLPNYLAVTGGTTAGVTSDCNPGATCHGGASIFGQLGSSWKTYAEGETSHCDHSNTGSYAVRHNPPPYYPALSNCSTLDVALASTPSFAAALTWVTPNLCHDMHDTCGGSSVAHGDAWLKGWLPKVLASAQYKAGTTAVFIWWDENTSAGPTLPFVVVSPYTHGVSYSGKLDHYSVLATVEQLLGKPCLGTACSRSSFASAFGL